MTDKQLFGGIVLVAVLLPAALFWGFHSCYTEQKEWERFKAEHNCVAVGHMKGDVGMGVGTGIAPSGKIGIVTVVTSTPDKTCWECDDGKRYWR